MKKNSKIILIQVFIILILISSFEDVGAIDESWKDDIRNTKELRVFIDDGDDMRKRVVKNAIKELNNQINRYNRFNPKKQICLHVTETRDHNKANIKVVFFDGQQYVDREYRRTINMDFTKPNGYTLWWSENGKRTKAKIILPKDPKYDSGESCIEATQAALALHELLHAAGLDGHAKYEKDVFSGRINEVENEDGSISVYNPLPLKETMDRLQNVWPLLSGISSTFTFKDNVVEMEVHVLADNLNKKIYDIEISAEDQEPPWENVEGIEAPKGWKIEKIGKEVRFSTEKEPLEKCNPVKFKFRVDGTISRYIKVHLTDKDGKNIGEIVSVLVYTPKSILGGMHSTFTLQYNVVELYIRVVDETNSSMIYSIEIFPEDQQPAWDSVEGIEAPEGWSFEKIDNGVRFYTETNPLLRCQRTRFIFKVRAIRISWYMRVHLTNEYYWNIGEIVSTRWWLYHSTTVM